VLFWLRGAVALALFSSPCLVAFAACSSHDAPACVVDPSPSCKPAYDPPVYATIFTKILQPTCATGAGTCHTSDAAMGSLALDNVDVAYDQLLGRNGAPRVRVVPGNPSCSLLMERLESSDPAFRMPRGDISLSAAEICTIAQWISAGAQR
jgi:hypothetical protein